MIWGGISLTMGKTELVFVYGNQDATDHTHTLRDYFNPFFDAVVAMAPDIKPRLMQDNASIHTAKESQRWLRSEKIEVLDWPAKSPDLNPIENAWAEMARMIYDHGRKRYDSLDDLKKAIQKAWDALSMEYIESAINSLPKGLEQCIDAKGDKINY
jgi:transposase